MAELPLQFNHIGCDLCGSDEKTVFIKTPSVAGELPAQPLIVSCKQCGLFYTDPRPDAPSVVRLYQRYYDSGGAQSVDSAAQRLVRSRPLLRRLWHAYCGQYLGEVLDKARGSVLDVGCGTGGLLEELRQAGCRVTGIELNPDSVDTCRKKGLDVRCGDLLSVDFPESSFDTVTLWHAIEHLPSPKQALLKIRRILKPGGRVFLYSPNAGSYCARYFAEAWWAWQVPFHFYHFTVSTLRRLSLDAGFIVEKCGAKTPEYFLHKSIGACLDGGRKATLFRLAGRSFYRTQGFRLMAAPLLRLLDFVMPGRGECLTFELRKPE